MKLDLDKYQDYHTRCFDAKPECGIKTLSVSEALNNINWMVRQCELNHKNPDEVPIFVKVDRDIYPIEYVGINHGVNGMSGTFETGDYYKLFYVAPDTEGAASTEVEWKSRGISDGLDLSGFVRSKPAGIRLLHMVQELLNKEETDSFLDYREYEPEWIQFKFKPSEFDLEKVEKLAKESGDKLSKSILVQCLRK